MDGKDPITIAQVLSGLATVATGLLGWLGVRFDTRLTAVETTMASKVTKEDFAAHIAHDEQWHTEDREARHELRNTMHQMVGKIHEKIDANERAAAERHDKLMHALIEMQRDAR